MRIPPRVIGWAVASAVAVATPVVATWEDKSNDPYDDLAGLPTVCYGETRVEMRRYSDAECNAMLRQAVEGFAKEVLVCTPILAEHPYQLAAATSLAYNIGAKAYCNSSIARKFNAGDLYAACQGFPAWKYVKGKVVRGLVNRRADEMELCMTGLKRVA